jgi:hypothetical protein
MPRIAVQQRIFACHPQLERPHVVRDVRLVLARATDVLGRIVSPD